MSRELQQKNKKYIFSKSPRSPKASTLIGLLLALVIIGLWLLKVFEKDPAVIKPNVDQQTKEFLSEEGIDTGSYQGVLETTLDQIEEIEQQGFDREKAAQRRMFRLDD